MIGALATACAITLAVPAPAALEAAPLRAVATEATATPAWVQRIDSLVAGRPVSVSIGVDGTWLYRIRNTVHRTPASNEKLLLTMALLDRLVPTTTIPTTARAKTAPVAGVVRGNLWIVGNGDPEGGRAEMAAMADALVTAGVTHIRGSVLGFEGPFARDDFAPGWLDFFPSSVIPIATALTYHGNVDLHGRIVPDPERRAALALTRALEARGVVVEGKPGMGYPAVKLVDVAQIQSAPLRGILSRMDHASINFYAEVMGKYLGQLAKGAPGTIASGAATIRGFAFAQGVVIASYDGSGLSYANRVTTDRIVRLLWYSGAQAWAPTLRNVLPSGGQGTLKGRLTRLRVYAKTGTLTNISALSGWVWLQRSGTWAEFSILSRGLSKDLAVQIENAIVKAVARHAQAPLPPPPPPPPSPSPSPSPSP